MPKNEALSGKNKAFFPLFIASLALISFLIGNFISTFLLFAIIILLVSFIYSAIKTRSLKCKLIRSKVKETSCILSFSILAALIVSIILPYIIFHDSFVNVYVIQYAYLFPVLFVFFMSLHFYSSLVNKSKIRYKGALKSSLIITAVVSAAVSMILIIGSIYVYNQKTELYNQGFEESILQLNNAAGMYEADMKIFDEIKAYQDSFLDSAYAQKAAFEGFDAEKGLCIKTDCDRNKIDKAYHLATVAVNSEVIAGMLNKANLEFNSVNSGQFRKEFASLEEYEDFLKSKIDASGFNIYQISVETKSTLNLIESDFSYGDFKELIKKERGKDAVGSFVLWLGPNPFFETDSLFFNSLSYALKHSTYFKELIRMVAKFSAYTNQQARNGDLFVQIYHNKDIEESAQSKIIRYRIILNRRERGNVFV